MQQSEGEEREQDVVQVGMSQRRLTAGVCQAGTPTNVQVSTESEVKNAIQCANEETSLSYRIEIVEHVQLSAQWDTTHKAGLFINNNAKVTIVGAKPGGEYFSSSLATRKTNAAACKSLQVGTQLTHNHSCRFATRQVRSRRSGGRGRLEVTASCTSVLAPWSSWRTSSCGVGMLLVLAVPSTTMKELSR